MAKSKKVESAHDRDRIIVRLPDGMRDKLATLAESNGRSMTAEVVAALERHLGGADRITLIWEFIEQHRKHIEGIPAMAGEIDELKYAVRPLIEEIQRTSKIIADAERKDSPE